MAKIKCSSERLAEIEAIKPNQFVALEDGYTLIESGKMKPTSIGKNSIELNLGNIDETRTPTINSTTVGSNNSNNTNYSTVLGTGNKNINIVAYIGLDLEATHVMEMDGDRLKIACKEYYGIENCVVGDVMVFKVNKNSIEEEVFATILEIDEDNNLLYLDYAQVDGVYFYANIPFIANYRMKFTNDVTSIVGSNVVVGKDNYNSIHNANIVGSNNNIMGGWSGQSLINCLGNENYIFDSKNSTIIGYKNTTSGNENSLVFGNENEVQNIQNITIGYKNTNNQNGSVMLGEGLIASNEYCVSLGKYNLGNSNSLFEVGVGTSSTRRNALELSIDYELIMPFTSKTDILNNRTLITKEFGKEQSEGLYNDFDSAADQTDFIVEGAIFTKAEVSVDGVLKRDTVYSISDDGTDTTVSFNDAQAEDAWIHIKYIV